MTTTTTTRESTKSASEDQQQAPKSFYGLAEHPNNGVITSLLKRKGRKLGMTDECKTLCKQVEAYKASADRLHQAMMFWMVENPSTSRQLVFSLKTEPGYKYAAMFLRIYEPLQNKGRKGTYDSLKIACESLDNLDKEHEKQVKKMLETVKPLTKFIGEEYWEYARLRRVYWESIEAFDDAITLQNKERTEQSERATAMAQTFRNDCRVKMMDFIRKSIIDKKGLHAECVVKFRDDGKEYHRIMSELVLLTAEEKTKTESPEKLQKDKDKSGIKTPTTPSK